MKNLIAYKSKKNVHNNMTANVKSNFYKNKFQMNLLYSSNITMCILFWIFFFCEFYYSFLHKCINTLGVITVKVKYICYNT